MARQGTYSAFQKLQPTTGFDPAKALMDVGDYQIRQDANRRANEQLEFLKSQYDDQRKDTFAKALAGDFDEINKLYVNTASKKVNQAQSEFIKMTKDKIMEVYGKLENDPDNPKLLSELDVLMNGAKFMSGSSEQIKSFLNDLTTGSMPSVDKDGKIINPKYNSYSKKWIDFAMSVADGKYDVGYENGRYVAAVNVGDGVLSQIPDEYETAKNGMVFVDLISLSQGNLQGATETSLYDDYYDYLANFNKNRIGELKITNDKNGKTIVNNTFENIKSKVRESVKKDFGEYGNLTKLGTTYLSEVVGMDWRKIDAMDEETYNSAINSIVDDLSVSFKGEESNTINTALMNAETSRVNAQTSRMNAETSRRKVAEKENNISTHVFKNTAGGYSKSYSLPKSSSVRITEGGEINVRTGEVDSKSTNNRYNNVVVSDKGEIYLTDGINPQRINAAGAASLANSLGFSTVNDLIQDAKNDINSQEGNTSNKGKGKFEQNPISVGGRTYN